MPLSDQIIADAKKNAKHPNRVYEHNDCIRMAYEWLDAQRTIKRQRMGDWKHLVEYWCGRHISDADIEIAALLHPSIQVRIYRRMTILNVSMRLVLPRGDRLRGISEAFAHVPDMDEDDKRVYAIRER